MWTLLISVLGLSPNLFSDVIMHECYSGITESRASHGIVLSSIRTPSTPSSEMFPRSRKNPTVASLEKYLIKPGQHATPGYRHRSWADRPFSCRSWGTNQANSPARTDFSKILSTIFPGQQIELHYCRFARISNHQLCFKFPKASEKANPNGTLC